jgi:hypothetical protein
MILHVPYWYVHCPRNKTNLLSYTFSWSASNFFIFFIS